jgi:hypothetical protein
MHNFRTSSPAIALLAAVSALSSSCVFHKTPVAFTPPPPWPHAPVQQTTPPLPPPPLIAGDPRASMPPDLPASIPELAAPPAPRPPTKKSAPSSPAKPVATPPAEPPPVQPPKLGQIFTPEEEREYNHTIDDSLDRVRRALAVLARKNLSGDQAEAVNRITSFQKQAEQSREAHDLANADLWAKRAATLAEDLLTRVP